MDKNCCENKQKNGLKQGLLYGLIPHTFCILFIIFSILGATSVGFFAKTILLIPNLFSFLIIISLVFATLSAFLYLKKNNCLCLGKIKSKWKYLSTLYGTTLIVNLLIMLIIFPAVANSQGENLNRPLAASTVNYVEIGIPCSGHAPLIIDELGKDPGIQTVSFKLPNTFKIVYDPNITSIEKITSYSVFKDFKPSKIY